MDVELRFISALLRASKQEQQRFYSRQVPKGVFVLRELEIDWVLKFRDKHNYYPSAKLFEAKFKEERLKKHKDTVDACLAPILDKAMFEQISGVVAETRKMLDEGREYSSALEHFKNRASQLTTYALDYNDIKVSDSRGAIVRYQQHVRDMCLGGTIIDTPWPTWNKLNSHYVPGDFIAIAARLNIGKTWVGFDWAHHLARRKVFTLIISEEMPTEKVEDRLDAIRFKLPYHDLRSGSLDPKILWRWKRDKRKAPKFDDYPLIICGNNELKGTSIGSVIAKIEQYQPQFVLIDGAYLLHAEGVSKNAGPVERFTWISHSLKAIAKNKRTVVCGIIQMNREAEDSKGKTKGSVKSVYGADAWAQDADTLVDISGQRGSRSRLVSLLKGRDSDIGEFNINFQLHPHPDFRELRGAANQKQQVVQFNATI